MKNRVAVVAMSFLFLSPVAMAAKPKHDAKVKIEDARATALKKVAGKVVAEELEYEKKRWIYSFEIKADGETGKKIHEINVDADTGVVVSEEVEND